jgi:CubicO group peptidase (beta-lactamase class C family)
MKSKNIIHSKNILIVDLSKTINCGFIKNSMNYIFSMVLMVLAYSLQSCTSSNKNGSDATTEISEITNLDSIPQSTNPLFWSPIQRDRAFRRMEDFLPTSKIEQGDSFRELLQGSSLNINLTFDGKQVSLDEFMESQKNVGIVVLHNGQLRLEKYKSNMTKDKRWISFSVTKSISSTLVGAAITDGFIKSIDDPITQYIPELVGSAYDGVSIQQVLTMTSGVRWNEDYTDPEADVSKFQNVKPQPGQDPTIVYMQTLEREGDPGLRWNYNTGETNLIGVLVSKASGKTLSKYLSEKIWKPYGMETEANWVLNAGISEYGGCCISATVRDFARFGQFVLDEINTENSSVLPTGWFSKAGKKQVSRGENGGGYGYQWWTFDDGAFSALGIFGQEIFIDPSRNLIIAINSNWDNALDSKYSEPRNILKKEIQKAIDQEK